MLIVKLVALFLAPFVIAIGSWELALLFPGLIATKHWHLFSSLLFVVAGFCAVVMLRKAPLRASVKALSAAVLTLPFLLFAFMFSLQSKCGDEDASIGLRERGQQVGSCGWFRPAIRFTGPWANYAARRPVSFNVRLQG
jgi:hypothetical protein